MPSAWAVLGLWLVFWCGGAAAGVHHVLRFRRIGTTFRGKVRFPHAARPEWRRRRVHAVWVHDVLVVGQGIVRPRVAALSSYAAEHAVRSTTNLEVTGLGANPAGLRLRLDNGRVVDVAAREPYIRALVGLSITAGLAALAAPDVRWNQ